MAGVIFPHRTHHHEVVRRSSLQKLCIGMGVLFVVAGVFGILVPGLMGLHLSMAHNLIHITSGLLALWCGYSTTNVLSFNYCLAFGSVYGLLGLAGMVLGEPGYPGVGFTHADQNLLRIIPDVLEFGTRDHMVHFAFSAVLLTGAYLWKREQAHDSAKVTVENQARAGMFSQEKGPTIISDSTSTTEITGVDIDRVRKIDRPDINQHL